METGTLRAIVYLVPGIRHALTLCVWFVADASADNAVVCSFQAFPGHSAVHASGGLHAGAYLRPPDGVPCRPSQGASSTRCVSHPAITWRWFQPCRQFNRFHMIS